MLVRCKVKGRMVKVECLDKACPERTCFSPGNALHLCSGGNWQEKGLSCVHRDYHGCPDAVVSARAAIEAEGET